MAELSTPRAGASTLCTADRTAEPALGIIRRRLNVIGAIMLRDMRTRFGRSHFGYIIAILWPLTHLTLLTVMFSLTRRSAPIFGTNNAVFLATGILPYILMLYPSRMIAIAIDTGKTLFIFPVVRALDIVLARVAVEFLTAFTVTIIFAVGCALFGVNLIPSDVRVAAAAIFATVYLSICFGMLSTIIVAVLDFWKIFSVLLLILAYITSGVFLPMSRLSPDTQHILSYNPLSHCVEWFRSAYFVGYGESFISPGYVFWTATTMLFLALVGERFIRGRLMQR